jgi:hypothetical protein
LKKSKRRKKALMGRPIWEEAACGASFRAAEGGGEERSGVGAAAGQGCGGLLIYRKSYMPLMGGVDQGAPRTPVRHLVLWAGPVRQLCFFFFPSLFFFFFIFVSSLIYFCFLFFVQI